MFNGFRRCLILFVLLMMLTGFIYPFIITAAGQALFPQQANGSLVEDNGKIIGSSLIGQNFAGDGYFHPRPSYAGNGYDASNSSGSNLGPTSADLAKAVGDRVNAFKDNGEVMPPVDIVTGSASGLDPDISPAAARFQAGRVAKARNMDLATLQVLIDQHITSRTFAIFGEPRVNVLSLNRALDQMAPMAK